MSKVEKIIWLVALAITLMVAVRGQIVITPGNCLDILPSNNTQGVCAQNVTPITIVYNYTNNVTNECPSVNKCVIENERIFPGDTFSLTNSNCDISIKARDCPNVESCRQGSTNYDVPYKIGYSEISKRIQINFGDKEYITQIDGNLDAHGSFNYTCPINVINSSNGGALTLDQCKSVVPMYCDTAFTVMMQRFEECSTTKTEYEQKLENLRQKQATMVESSVCIDNQQYAELLSQKLSLDNRSTVCSNDMAQVTFERDDLQSTQIFLIVIIVLLSGACIFLGIKYKKAITTGIPKEDM